MRNYFAILPLLVFWIVDSAAQDNSIFQKEIDTQVWKPFIEFYNNYNQEGLRTVHSKDVIRVQQDDNTIIGADEYFKSPTDAERALLSGRKVRLELRFVQRIADSKRAFEVGYYKTTVTNVKSGSTRSSYGKFHVLLRKEGDTWKILMDADANENTDESVFLTGAAIQ
jgi:ketosteroid isomerase-like protein